MRDQIDLLATVTVLGVLEQEGNTESCPAGPLEKGDTLTHDQPATTYFAMQVIHARRKYKISPPETTGHPEFERTFRAQANCSEYFPIFISLIWVAGIFLHQGVTAVCGLLYLYTRLRYFQGYAVAAQGRLGPLYASAWLLWVLVVLALAGLVAHFLRPSSSTWMAALLWPLQLRGAW